MPIPINPKEVREFVLAADRIKPVECRTVFLIAPIPLGVQVGIDDDATAFNGVSGQASVRTGTRRLTVLRAGLKGWRDFADADGTAVPFETMKRTLHGVRMDVPTDDTLERLHADDRDELAAAIEDWRMTAHEGNG